MVTTGILGASSPLAGELIRILVHHPDVEIITLYEPDKSGINVSELHHGLVGEQLPLLSEFIPTQMPKVWFITSKSEEVKKVVGSIINSDIDVKIIDVSGVGYNIDKNFVYGMPEINRKLLVRGATKAVVPSPVASATLVTLFPMASHLLLNSDIYIKAIGPTDSFNSRTHISIEEEIRSALSNIQKSWLGNVHLECSTTNDRSLSISIAIKSPIDASALCKIYNKVYEDHNFAFASTKIFSSKEVIGTEKCLVSIIQLSEGNIRFESFADARLRGSAGEAVHIMNLLFGLHERVGLTLKASTY